MTDELKTLKDIYPYKEDKFGKYYKDKDLKEEAVNWYKKHAQSIGDYNSCLAVQTFIKHFFNLTEEDLKDE